MKRRIVLPAILALSTAGSILAGTAVSLAATSAPAVVAAAAHAAPAKPNYVYDD